MDVGQAQGTLCCSIAVPHNHCIARKQRKEHNNTASLASSKKDLLKKAMALCKGDCDKWGRKDSLVKKGQKVKNMLSVKYHKTLTGSVVNTRCLCSSFILPLFCL